MFVSWVFVILTFCEVASSEVRKILVQSYRDGQHLPCWLDLILYGTQISILAMGGWFVTASLWTLIAFIDLSHRVEAEKGARP